MASKLSHFCDGVLEAGWLVALIAVPLFFNIHSERVFEPDKVAIMRSIAVLMLFAWPVRFIDRRGWQEWQRVRWRDEKSIWRIPFLIPILALVLVYLISTLLSVTPRVSWAGSYQRLQGTYTTVAYVVIFVSAVTTIRNRVQMSRIPTAVIITSIPIAFYGLIQHFGLDPLPWGGDVVVRVAGHMGNAIFIAAYLIMAVPLTLGRIIDAFANILGDETVSYADVVRSGIYICALAMQLLAIYWSGSRGPLIGLAAGMFSFTLVLLVSLRNSAAEEGKFLWKDALLAFVVIIPPLAAMLAGGVLGNLTSPAVSFSLFLGGVIVSIALILLLVVLRKGWKWLWLSWLLLTTLLAGWLLLFNLPAPSLVRLAELPVIGNAFEAQIEWKELPNVGSYGRMLDPSQTKGREKSNRVRVLIWEGVVDLISPHSPLTYADGGTDSFNFWRPLLGYGPESMYVVYNRFYPPELATVEARNASPDRSHNETFDAFVITGLAGFLAWQALYISVFYYGFKYLGVVRTRRDSTMLICAWAGGALLGAILSFTLFDPIYLGVAIPMGTLVGLILYLFYYALFTPSGTQEGAGKGYLQAFQTDRLLVNALLAAVLAHYVEVHFGIAIAATRLEFFLFVALIFVIAYKLPLARTAQDKIAIGTEKRRGESRHPGQSDVWGPVLAWAFLIALLVGTLGYDFMNYVLPADKLIETGTDLLPWDILWQSFFVNAQKGFRDSPFVFLMVILSWALGVSIVFSEMIRQKVFSIAVPSPVRLTPSRYRAASAGFVLLGLLGLAQTFLLPRSPGPTAALARSFFLFGGIVSLWVAWNLLRNNESGRLAGVLVATVGLILAFPFAISGSGAGAIALAVLCATLLYALWDPSLRSLLLPPVLLALGSLVIGMLFTYIHAVLVRDALLYLVFFQGVEPISSLFSLFFRPGDVVASVEQVRVLEARQSLRFLSSYYFFLFIMLILAGYSLARRSIALAPKRGEVFAYAGAVPAILLAAVIVLQTNVRPVQADMIFKRGRPFDEQATRVQEPLPWDVAIAIYEEALDLAPLEDFYFLFLGRAYLERSALAETKEEQLALLNKAERRLLDARELNPLNTDHSANLARLNTRWAVTSDDPEDRETRLRQAETYYLDALEFSPQNSLIRNEFARLAFDMRRDCDLAIDIFRQSQTIDPFFSDTYFGFADVLATCAEAQIDDSVEQELYLNAIESLNAGLSLEPQQARAWIQTGQINNRLSRYDEALAAFEQARKLNEISDLPTWNVDFLEADTHKAMGDIAKARALAEQALQSAPADIAAQIESFLDGLE